jgi:putative Mg2+ transporter-C (MgtC) family protein
LTGHLLDLELIIRIAVGTLLGAVIGYERDIHGRPAGLRTHALVALASATFMVVSTHMVFFQNYHDGDHVEVDSSRIAASVVSGIGFLAGGAILRTGLTIQGLTTAAGLWLVAAIGLCAGGGMYVESVAVTTFGIGALTLLRRFEDKDDRVRRKLTLVLTDKATATQELVDKLVAADLLATVEGWDNDIHGARRQLTLSVRLPRSGGERTLLELLEAEPGIARVQLDPAS